MNKKLISALLAIGVLASSIGVFAEGILIGESGTDEIVFDGITSEYVIFNGYDDDGKLAYSQSFKAEDGRITIPSEVADEYKLRAYDVDSGEIMSVKYDDSSSTDSTATPVPTATPDPSATATPAPTATPEATDEPNATQNPESTYNPNVFPDSYGEASVAVNAFSVVEQVSNTMNGSEQGYTVDYYYHGEKHSVWLENDIQIVSAPDSENALIGSNVSALKRGDVIYINRAFGGEIKEIALLYRPLSKDIVNSTDDYGTNFEKLFSVNGVAVGGYSGWGVVNYGSQVPSKGTYYAFGVSARRDGGTLYLLNKSGNTDDAIELSLPEDVVAYKCDMTKTTGIDSIRMGQIVSSIPSSIWDDAYGSDEPVIELDDTEYDYVLARVVDGTVMDIILYTY